jgi:hypothetical protein
MFEGKLEAGYDTTGNRDDYGYSQWVYRQEHYHDAQTRLASLLAERVPQLRGSGAR